MVTNLKKVELDELEMYLQLIKLDEDLSNLTCKDIALLIQKRFEVECSEEDVFLLHEPEVYDVWYDEMYYYKNVLGL